MRSAFENGFAEMVLVVYYDCVDGGGYETKCEERFRVDMCKNDECEVGKSEQALSLLLHFIFDVLLN